jgi:hypothetical protein
VAAGALAATAGVTAQQPATAGATRPNLRVLQALPEAQLFPLMNLVAVSLGVGCDFCHAQVKPDLTKTPSNVGGWIWNSDDKPQKQIAREMMRMVVDLNAGRFSGQSRVTCYTCHRGSTQPERLPVLPPLSGVTRTALAAPLPPADSVWTNYLNAVGEVDSTARGGGTLITGWDDRPEGRYGKFQVTLADGDRYRAALSTADGTATQALDGDTAWAAFNDRVQRLAPADVARVRRVMIRYRPVKVDRPADLKVIGVDRTAGRDLYVVTARIDALNTRTLYFDVVTGLLRRDLITTETLLLPLEEQVEYDDYRSVDGVRLPFWMRISDGAPYGTTTRTIAEIRHKVAVDDALFQPPAPR